MPELDPTTTPDPTDPTDGTAPGLSRRQALAVGGGLAAAAAVVGGAGPAAAQTTPTPGVPGRPTMLQSISLDQAREVVRRAEARARAIGVAMHIVVLDVCGDVKASSRQDGNSPAALVLAPLKAQTALAFRSPSANLGGAGAPRERVQSLVAAGYTDLGGGLPIRNADGTAVIGAVGVGGGTAAQDVDVASAGLGQRPPAS